MTGVMPQTISAHLGATLTITGVGFPPAGTPPPEVSVAFLDLDPQNIYAWPEPCEVVTYTAGAYTRPLPSST